MKAFAVIGSNYGDEGKGLITDYLCETQRAGMVVRFNGGAQAGHTVVEPDGRRHVFHNFGSGSLLGVPTFLSHFFITNPVLFCGEDDALQSDVEVFVHRDSLVTTPADMLINQALAARNGHGSCGVGINETMQRSMFTPSRLTVDNMDDLFTYRRIMSEYVPMRLQLMGLQDVVIEPYWEDVYFEHVKRFKRRVQIVSRPNADTLVFEGAQGLMLDKDHPDFPHVTHSHTGLRNVKELCDMWGCQDLHAVYVTRSYLTRHGAGPLPGEKPMPDFVQDETNVPNTYQGTLRYAPLDVHALKARIDADLVRNQRVPETTHSVAVTCLDQLEGGQNIVREMNDAGLPVRFLSHGPSRIDVKDLNND